MPLRMIGASHRSSSVKAIERLTLSKQQVREALAALKQMHPGVEVVLLSTCNRVEFYSAAEEEAAPLTRASVARVLAALRDLPSDEVAPLLVELEGPAAIEHLFAVVCSLDSMVVGEAQILAQAKDSYAAATDAETTGPATHAAFQAALHAAKRVAGETGLHQRRVSIPSVAVTEFAKAIFERFDNKQVLVIGAGEMADETLNYLVSEGVRDITVLNRSFQRAEELARRFSGRAEPWERLIPNLAAADLVVSTTGAEAAIVTEETYRLVDSRRQGRPQCILDLAMPRDFAPAIGEFAGVYLYAIDDLQRACEANRRLRLGHLEAAWRIVREETARFVAQTQHRGSASTIRQLQQQADEVKLQELTRLWNKLGPVDERVRDEIAVAFDRLVKKLLHPPLESLRDDARRGGTGGLLEALKELFRLNE